MLNNVLLYLPFGFCFALLVEPRFGRTAASLAATLAGALLSLYMELLQASVPMRVASLKDLSLNAVGALAGAMLGSTWHLLGARMAPQSSAQGRSRAVIVAILGPVVSRQALAARPGHRPAAAEGRRASAVLAAHRTAELATYFVGWLVVAQAVFSLAPRQRAVDALLIVIAVVLVGRTVTGATRS